MASRVSQPIGGIIISSIAFANCNSTAPHTWCCTVPGCIDSQSIVESQTFLYSQGFLSDFSRVPRLELKAGSGLAADIELWLTSMRRKSQYAVAIREIDADVKNLKLMKLEASRLEQASSLCNHFARLRRRVIVRGVV